MQGIIIIYFLSLKRIPLRFPFFLSQKRFCLDFLLYLCFFSFSFYRYVLEPDVKFNADGSQSPGPLARFENLPQKSLLTLNMHPPESWLVESVKSLYDLDNIMLEEVSQIQAIFFFITWILKH